MIRLFYNVVMEMMNTLPPVVSGLSENWVQIALVLAMAYYGIITICLTIKLIKKHVNN